jgi:alkaline phosphatase
MLFFSVLCVFLLLISGIKAAYGQEPAKQIILLIADGWGPHHIAATKTYTGDTPIYQSDPAWVHHWMSTFSYGGSYNTTQAWTDFNYVLQGPTDSAAAATALYSGSKTMDARINVSHDGSARLFTIGEKAKSLGRAVGAITTVQVSDATPGAFCAHNDARSNRYAIADECLFGDPNTTGTIANDPKYAGGHGPTTPSIDVLIGDRTDGYINDAIRDKLFTESGQPGKHFFVERQTGTDGGDALLTAANGSAVNKLAGLFDFIYRHDPAYSAENPTLTESAIAALTVLRKNPNGFILMIEGGAVDWAAHENNMDLMIGEMIDFNEAVQAVIDWVDNPADDIDWNNTLVIVTGDHECGYLTAGPGIFQNQPLGEVSDTTLALEKIISGSGGRRASWNDLDNDSVIDAGETVYWAWNSGGHTNTLIPLYARGAGADQLETYAIGYDSVRGYYLDNTDVFSAMNSVMNIPPTANNDTATTNENTPVNINVIANDTDSDGSINPATVTITGNPANGAAVANGNGTVTYTPTNGFDGTDTFTYTVNDNEGATSNQATVTVTVTSGSVTEFTAYNDLGWVTGQINNYITVYTTGQNGLMKDYATGIDTAVTLTIAGGGSAITTQGSNANSGTDAYNVFNGIVNSVGLISYSATNLTFTFTGLDPNLTYEFVFFGNRNNASYTDRMTTTAISDVAYFTNSSTAAADFSGPSDPSVTIVNGYNTVNGYVARFTNINPGPDGDMLITVSSPTGQFYANALMLKAVQLANIPPTANNDTATTNENTPVNINVIANDTDSDGTIDPATVTITGNPANGAAVANGNGTVTYTPNTGFSGTDTFRYKVKDNGRALSNEATVTVTVMAVTSGFSDDFSINTIGTYTVLTEGGVASFLYDSVGKRAQVLTGDNVGLQFAHNVPSLGTGTFSIDFLPTQKYPYGGWLYIRLVQDAGNYYDIQNTDGYGPKSIRKIVNGTVVDSASFTSQYTQNTNYHITVNFSPDQTTVNAFGQTITISTNKSSIPINRFEIEVQQQDAYFDNISYIQ